MSRCSLREWYMPQTHASSLCQESPCNLKTCCLLSCVMSTPYRNQGSILLPWRLHATKSRFQYRKLDETCKYPWTWLWLAATLQCANRERLFSTFCPGCTLLSLSYTCTLCMPTNIPMPTACQSKATVHTNSTLPGGPCIPPVCYTWGPKWPLAAVLPTVKQIKV